MKLYISNYRGILQLSDSHHALRNTHNAQHGRIHNNRLHRRHLGGDRCFYTTQRPPIGAGRGLQEITNLGGLREEGRKLDHRKLQCTVKHPVSILIHTSCWL